ncbi:transglycosylase domain-containing protein [Lipingzhangella sp. LS1_29]|uniref:Transglycosylase domain-containing protein n=1 Tax=Lipingzhangella rawalii TaxID=2055835 RepID=A0ABU2H815_9ACTN|nr:transglycosylase domain-containing protein [Lipingzhangella rawalii]MDS1271453.1 transglycosylase domain-containing protein [Lipingzhangella rawalii]
MSTERRRSAGGRRRSGDPAGDGHGAGPRRRSERAQASQSATHSARSESGRRRPRAEGGARPGGFRRFCARAWKPFLAVSGLAVVGVVTAFGIWYAAMPGPDELGAQAEADATATVIRFADESEVGTTGEMNRVPITIDQVPDAVIDGVLASEQRQFYQEPAISPAGTARAILSGGEAGGGSSITQQMARNYYNTLSREQTYTRKIREIMVAMKVDQSLSKDQILEQYLNTIYFGRNAYGIQAAAQAYFGKNIDELDEAEGALMGALIQQPGNFENAHPDDPIWEVLQDRWAYSVNGMVEMHENGWGRGGLSQQEADALEFPEPIEREGTGSYDGYNGYIIEAVKSELAERYDLPADQIQQGGYTVTTSIDEDLMEAAEAAVEQNRPEGTAEETNFGLAAVEPETGQIRAFYGGESVFEDTDNSLIQRGQAGSAYKPYVLAEGLSQGIALSSQFDGDSPQEFPGLAGEIQNNDNRSWGTVDLVESTAHSVNTSFVELGIEVGAQNVTDLATNAGVSPDHAETAELGPNIALGTYSVTALDQASGYATFANAGTHIPQHMVTEVIDANNDVLEPNDADVIETGEEVFSPDVAADATYAMTQVVEGGGAESAALDDGRPVAGKTGTSTNSVSAWFAGFTPQLSTAVGLHRSDGEPVQIPGTDTLYGSTVPAAMWKDFMTVAMEGEEHQQFPPRANVGEELNFEPSPSPTPTETPTAEADPTPTESPSPTPTPTETPTFEPPPLPEACRDAESMEEWHECRANQPTEEPEPGNPDGGPGDGDDNDNDRLFGGDGN